MPTRKPSANPHTRSVRMVIRVTPSEQQALISRSSHAEMNVTDYIRTRALDIRLTAKSIRAPSTDRLLLSEAIGILGDIGSDVRAMRDQVGAGDTPFLHKADYVLGKLVSASEAILRALGQRP